MKNLLLIPILISLFDLRTTGPDKLDGTSWKGKAMLLKNLSYY